MRRRHLYLLVSILLATGFTASGAEPRNRPIDLSRCIRIGLANNLKLRNIQIDTSIAKESVSGAKGVYDSFLSAEAKHSNTDIPDPGSFLKGHKELTDINAGVSKTFTRGTLVGVNARHTKMVIPGNDFITIPPYGDNISVSVSQPLFKNYFGVIDRARVEYAEYGQSIAEHMARHERNLVSLRIAETYWDLYTSLANYDVAKRSLKLANELLESNKKKEEDGLLDETDILAAEATIASRDVDVLTLSNRVQTARDNLSSIIQLPSQQRDSANYVFPEAGSISARDKSKLPDSAKLSASALKQRPDIAAITDSIQRAIVDIKMRNNAMKPEINVIGSLARGDTDIDQEDSMAVAENAWSVGVTFKTSLSKKKEKSELKVSELSLKKANNDLKNLKDTVSLECRFVTRTMHDAREAVKATKKAMKLYEKKLFLERKKFAQGRSDTRWVIQAQDELTHAEMTYHVALARYQKAEAAIWVVQGLGLDDVDGRTK